MQVFVVKEAWYSSSGYTYYTNIIAAFRTDAKAKLFVEQKGWRMEPGEPATPFYAIQRDEVRDGSRTVPFLRFKNSFGYLNNPTVYKTKNEARVKKTLHEAQILERNEHYIIDFDVDFNEVEIQ